MRRLLFLALSLALVATQASAAGITDIVRKGFDVPAGGTLRLDGFGDIHVVSGGTGVAVEIVRTASTHDAAKATKIFKDHELVITREGNDVVIHSRFEHEFHLFQWNDPLRVKYNIRVPSHYNVDLSTSGGEIELGDIGGNVTCKTSGGSIKGARVAGNVTAKTSGGDVSLAGITGEADVRTSGGDISIGDAAASLTAHTSGGSIRIDRAGANLVAHTSGGSIDVRSVSGSVDASTSGGSIDARFIHAPAGDSRLQSSGGSLNVSIAAGAGIDLDAHASGGDVDSDIPVMTVGKQKDSSLAGKVNGGGPRLVLRTSGGDITLRKM